MSKVFIVDLNRCNGCFNCQIACKDEHCDNDWSPIAKPQPMTGQFWCAVEQTERGRVPVVRVSYRPVFCGHCDDCPLIEMAPDCVHRTDEGFVIIDPEKSRGRKDLVDACPMGRVFWNESLEIPQKCTGCTHLLQNGWKEPRCVDVCATGALRFGDEEDFKEEIASGSREVGSHVIYLNEPKRWIAGTVADRMANEVIIGADVSLFDERSNLVQATKTDDFGDFRFYGCEEKSYRVVIAAQGWKTVSLKADCREKDFVFNDIFVKPSEKSEDQTVTQCFEPERAMAQKG